MRPRACVGSYPLRSEKGVAQLRRLFALPRSVWVQSWGQADGLTLALDRYGSFPGELARYVIEVSQGW